MTSPYSDATTCWSVTFTSLCRVQATHHYVQPTDADVYAGDLQSGVLKQQTAH